MCPIENDAKKRKLASPSASKASVAPAGSEEQSARYIIQIERPDQKVDMALAQELLKDTGVELDASYRPILVNPKLGRYVVRGFATPSARSKAETVPGVSFFSDTRQTAVSGRSVPLKTQTSRSETRKESKGGAQDHPRPKP